MAKQISVNEEVYQKLDMIRYARSKMLSFNTLLEILADEKLEGTKDDGIRNRLAFVYSKDFVFRAFRAGLLDSYNDQVADAIRFLLVGKYETVISIVQALTLNLPGE